MKYINSFFSFIILFILNNNITSLFYVLMDLKWGWSAVILNILLSILILFFIRKKIIVWFENKSVLQACLFIIAYTLLIYLHISPVTELRQDPALYMYKALNLINHGYTYMPMEELQSLIKDKVLSLNDYSGYAKIHNGTKYIEGRLTTDFYSGSSFLMAVFGLAYKPLAYYGATFIMILNSIIMFLLLNKIAGKNYIANAVYTVAFITTPLIVFFGRSPFSEPIALLYFLLILYVLSIYKSNDNSKAENILLILLAISGMAVRIDYALIFLICIFIITLTNIRLGAVTASIGLAVWYLLSYIYPTYYTRILSNDMPVLKYVPILIIIVFMMGIFFNKIIKERITYIIDNIYVKRILIIFSIFILLLFFREYIQKGNYEIVTMFGKEMRSYSEAIFYSLYNVFPFFIIIIGFIFLYKFLDKTKYNLKMIIFLFGVFLPYCSLFIDAGNSPQLYWLARRYYNILIPVLFLSYVAVISRTFSRNIILVISILTFMYVNVTFVLSKQIPNYEGLNYSLIESEKKLKNHNIDLIFYDKKDRYPLSSIISYSGIEAIPVNIKDDMEQIDKIIKNIKNKNVVIISRDKYDKKAIDKFKISYRIIGETYKDLPKNIYIHTYNFTIYR